MDRVIRESSSETNDWQAAVALVAWVVAFYFGGITVGLGVMVLSFVVLGWKHRHHMPFGTIAATDEWRPNPLTHIFPFLIGFWGWQVSGIVVGLVAALAYVGLAIFCNCFLLSKTNIAIELSDDVGWPNPFNFLPLTRLLWMSDHEAYIDFHKKMQRNKWIIFLVFMFGISISAAEFVPA